jgi:DNA primase
MLNPSDEIKSKLDIVEVIRQYVPLKAAGTNFTGRCPFHNEKTPSFTVSPTKQVWHCFGCGKGGDLFSFIMEIESLSFPEALRLLAPKAGVVLTRETGPLASQRNRILDVLDQATRFYHTILLKELSGEPARAYLSQRGLKLETIKEWEIGYAPQSWDDVIIFLKSKKFSDEDIFLAGLSVRKAETGRTYNRFRGRILFPLREVNGNVVGFTGRILPEFENEDRQGKYVNSPQSMVYDKSKLVFGLDKAKQAIREFDLAILVEGQMDCITAHEAGFKNVIASSGTALTEDQVRLLQRYTNKIALAYDMDSAGRLAAERASDHTLAAEMETLIISLPEGKDPDECIRRNPEGWKQAVRDSRPITEYFFEEIISSLDLSQTSDRRLALKKLLPRIAKVVNNVERDFWIKKISQVVETDEMQLRKSVMAATLSARTTSDSVNSAILVDNKDQDRPELLSEQLLGLLMRYPSYINSVASRLPIDQLVNPVYQNLYRLLVIYYNKIITVKSAQADGTEESLDYAEFRKWLLEFDTSIATDIQVFDRLALLVERNFFETTFEQAQVLIGTSIKELRHYYLNSRLKVVTRLISELESHRDRSSTDEERLLELLKEFKGLADEIRQLAL